MTTSPPIPGATGAQGASGVESTSTDITAEEFLAKLLPEKEIAVEAVIATEPECEGVKVEPSLVLVISDDASKADPDTPLTELVDGGVLMPRRRREPAATVDYTDPEGNVLTLRESLSSGSIRKIAKAREKGAATVDDDWRRRTEMLFERLAVRWEIAGLPIDEQKLLIGRYRMADSETQQWVRRTLTEHVERYIPELG